MIDGKAKGIGEQSMNSGHTYKGEVVNDLREGVGIYEYPSGNTYSGDWKDDKMHGYGQYSDVPNEQIYEGGECLPSCVRGIVYPHHKLCILLSQRMEKGQAARLCNRLRS